MTPTAAPLDARSLNALLSGAGPIGDDAFESALVTSGALSLLLDRPGLEPARLLRVAEAALSAIRWSHSRDAEAALRRLVRAGTLPLDAGVGRTLYRLATGAEAGASGAAARRTARLLVLETPGLTPSELGDLARTLPPLDPDWARIVRHPACTPDLWRTALERDTVGTVLDLVSMLDAAMVHPTVRTAVAAHPASTRAHRLSALRGAQGAEFAAGWRAYTPRDPELARALWRATTPAQRSALSAPERQAGDALMQQTQGPTR